MHLAIITSNYPFPGKPAAGTFVQQFAHAVARQGVRCTVIHPIGIHYAIRGLAGGKVEIEDAGDNSTATVHRPRFISCSTRQLGNWNTFALTYANFRRAVQRILYTQMPDKPNTLYGHFLYPAGAAAVDMGQKFGLPAFIGLGESVKSPDDPIWTLQYSNKKASTKRFAKGTGFIANSSLLAKALNMQLKVDPNRTAVFPNGILKSIFKPLNKTDMRIKFNLPSNDFLIAVSGSISERKGQYRVLEAINGLTNVKAVFIGGSMPEHAQVAFADSVLHQQVPCLLSACDAFVLPTLAEGCCNATLEAMACGLPVISSNGAFNDDILNDDLAIRVDPLSIKDIRSAILKLQNDPTKRQNMAKKSLAWSSHFDVNVRAQKIIEWINSRPDN